MKLLTRMAALCGLSATLLVATPPAQRLIAETAASASEVRKAEPTANKQAAPAPTKEPARPVNAWDNLLLHITRRRREEDEFDGFPWFRRIGAKRHNRRKHRAAMNGWAYCLLAAALSLSACTASHPIDARLNAELSTKPVKVDSAARQNPTPENAHVIKPGFIARIFHKEASKQDIKKTSNPTGFINPIPRKCKGCQFTVITGNDNKVSQASAGKVKAPTVQASDSVAQNVAGPGSQQQAVNGNGNDLKADKHDTTLKPGFWQSPAGYTVAAALAGIGGYGLYLAWPVLLAILPKRRKDPAA